jgi:hypothetical protein
MLRWLTSLARLADTRHVPGHPFTPVIRVDLVVVGPLPVYLLQPTFRPRMGTEPARRARVQYLTGNTTIGDAAN